MTESAPTTATVIAGATVTIADGPNAGRTANSDASGNYSFTGLQQSGFSVTAMANGYSSLSRGVTLTSSQTLSFALAPTPRVLSDTFNDVVNGGSAICQNFFSTSTLPCVKYLIPAHNSGFLSAVLTWSNSRTNLDLELVREPGLGSTDRIVISRFSFPTGREEVSATLTAGVLYSIRVLYDTGAVAQSFTLVLNRPN